MIKINPQKKIKKKKIEDLGLSKYFLPLFFGLVSSRLGLSNEKRD